MGRLRGYEVVLGALIATAIWSLVFVFQPNSEAARAQPQQAPKEEAAKISTDERIADYTWWLAVLTGGLTFSTVGLWWVTWRAGRRQIRETEILQRAYIAVEPGGITPHVDRPDRSHGNVIFRNVGHLTARNVRWWGDFGSPKDWQAPEIEEMFGGHIVLPPGTASRQRFGTVFTVRYEGSNLNYLGDTVYVWGIVTYEDGFGRERFTRFCHVYPTKDRINGQWVAVDPEFGELHEYGNDAD